MGSQGNPSNPSGLVVLRGTGPGSPPEGPGPPTEEGLRGPGGCQAPGALLRAVTPLPTPKPCGERMFPRQTGREMHLGPGLGNWEKASRRHGWRSRSPACGVFQERRPAEPWRGRSARTPPPGPVCRVSVAQGEAT